MNETQAELLLDDVNRRAMGGADPLALAEKARRIAAESPRKSVAFEKALKLAHELDPRSPRLTPLLGRAIDRRDLDPLNRWARQVVVDRQRAHGIAPPRLDIVSRIGWGAFFVMMPSWTFLMTMYFSGNQPYFGSSQIPEEILLGIAFGGFVVMLLCALIRGRQPI